MTAKEGAEYARTTVGNLAQLRYRGEAPRFHRVGGRKVLYDRADLDAWIEGEAQ